MTQPRLPDVDAYEAQQRYRAQARGQRRTQLLLLGGILAVIGAVVTVCLLIPKPERRFVGQSCVDIADINQSRTITSMQRDALWREVANRWVRWTVYVHNVRRTETGDYAVDFACQSGHDEVNGAFEIPNAQAGPLVALGPDAPVSFVGELHAMGVSGLEIRPAELTPAPRAP